MNASSKLPITFHSTMASPSARSFTRQTTRRSTGLLDVRDAYVSMASAGRVTPAQREVCLRAGVMLKSQQGCEAIMLAGTDLALVFKEGDDPGLETLDCAALHAAAIAMSAMSL